MKKRIVSLAISAAFVLAVFSGCAAMRRNTTNDIRGIDAYDRSSDNLRNYLGRTTTGTTDSRLRNDLTDSRMFYDPINTAYPYAGDGTTTRRPLTVDHLASLIGMNNYDAGTALGQNYRTRNDGTSAGRVYSHMMYGNSADIDVSFDGVNRIEQISVTASRADAQRWERELNARYGAQINGGVSTGEWIADGARIVMQPVGDNVRIVFSNAI